jgi:hypothetical protein
LIPKRSKGSAPTTSENICGTCEFFFQRLDGAIQAQ